MAQANRNHENRIQALEQWKNGNGAKGAESRLQAMEDKYVSSDQIPEVVRSAMRMIHDDDRKDWNKWVNTAMLAVMVVGQVILLVELLA